jgi:hypothetical protein
VLRIDTEITAPVTMSGQNVIRLVNRRARPDNMKYELTDEQSKEHGRESTEG